MHLKSIALLVLASWLSLVHGHPEDHLTVSAVIHNITANNAAAFQCWSFVTPFSTYPTVGRALDLADVSNMTYVVLPPQSAEGLHRPPHPMLFVLLKGLAHVRLPADPKVCLPH